MACIITYENKQYTQKEFEQYFKEHFTEFVDNFLGSKQDVEGFKNFVKNNTSDYSDYYVDYFSNKNEITKEEFMKASLEEQQTMIDQRKKC
jgi:hypothetical protein